MNRNLARNLWLLGPIAFGVLAAIPAWCTHDESESAVTVWSVGALNLLWIVAAVWLLFLVGLRRVTQGRRGPERSFGNAVGVALVLGWCMSMFVRSGGWNLGQRATASDQRAVAMLWCGFVDHSVAVAQRTSDHVIAETYAILALGDPSSHRTEYAPLVVRPAGADADGLMTCDGCAAFVETSPTRCLCAAGADGRPLVDIRIQRPDGSPVTPILRSSPFFLVGRDQRVEESDVAALVAALTAASQSGAAWPIDLPADEGLVEALGSGNVSVRAAAERLVRAGGARAYPQATARLGR